MTNSFDPDQAFAADLAARCPALELRGESADDAAFLTGLFAACSPLAGLLPPAMIEQQAQFQQQGYRADFPAASRWIVTRSGEPIGRFMADWNADGQCLLIDVALLPREHGAGIGTALLQSFIAIAGRQQRACCLQVLANNPAAALYRKLGFGVVGDPVQPSVTMVRPFSG
jgi:ribosomal protein S18 acetylase RimI-like enzyme